MEHYDEEDPVRCSISTLLVAIPNKSKADDVANVHSMVNSSASQISFKFQGHP